MDTSIISYSNNSEDLSESEIVRKKQTMSMKITKKALKQNGLNYENSSNVSSSNRNNSLLSGISFNDMKFYSHKINYSFWR